MSLLSRFIRAVWVVFSGSAVFITTRVGFCKPTLADCVAYCMDLTCEKNFVRKQGPKQQCCCYWSCLTVTVFAKGGTAVKVRAKIDASAFFLKWIFLNYVSALYSGGVSWLTSPTPFVLVAPFITSSQICLRFFSSVFSSNLIFIILLYRYKLNRSKSHN